jgi:hypothetical protein
MRCDLIQARGRIEKREAAGRDGTPESRCEFRRRLKPLGIGAGGLCQTGHVRSFDRGGEGTSRKAPGLMDTDRVVAPAIDDEHDDRRADCAAVNNSCAYMRRLHASPRRRRFWYVMEGAESVEGTQTRPVPWICRASTWMCPPVGVTPLDQTPLANYRRDEPRAQDGRRIRQSRFRAAPKDPDRRGRQAPQR